MSSISGINSSMGSTQNKILQLAEKRVNKTVSWEQKGQNIKIK